MFIEFPGLKPQLEIVFYLINTSVSPIAYSSQLLVADIGKMTSHLLILLAAAVFFVVHLLIFITRPIRSPLKSVGGPFLARFSDVWYFWTVRKGHFEVTNRELHEEHGSCYGNNSIIVVIQDANSSTRLRCALRP